MTFNVVCPSCGLTLSATDTDVGKPGQCSRCHTVFTIQAPAPVPPDAVPPVVVGDVGMTAVPGGMQPAWFTQAADRVQLPAIGLIVTAVLGLIGNVGGVIAGLFGGQQPLPPNIPPEFADFLQLFRGPVGIAMNLLGLLISTLVLVGSIKMMNLRSYGLAMVATIVALVPCASPCCCTGLPIGIWSLVVLLNSDVQAAFRAQASTPGGPAVIR